MSLSADQVTALRNAFMPSEHVAPGTNEYVDSLPVDKIQAATTLEDFLRLAVECHWDAEAFLATLIDVIDELPEHADAYRLIQLAAHLERW